MLKTTLLILALSCDLAFCATSEKIAMEPAKMENAAYEVFDHLTKQQGFEIHKRNGDETHIFAGNRFIGSTTESEDGKETHFKPAGSGLTTRTLFNRPIFRLAHGEKVDGQIQKINRLTNEVVESHRVTVTIEKIGFDITKYTYQTNIGDNLLVRVMAMKTGFRLPQEIVILKFVKNNKSPMQYLEFLRTQN